MTDSDMPVASATPPVASPKARVSARARARLAGALRDCKVGKVGAAVASDARRWWLLTAEPPSLADWMTATKPSSDVPDSPLLRLAWRVDSWTTGLPFLILRVLLFLAAGAMAWLSTPLRRWSVLLTVGALLAYWLLGR